MRAASGPAQTRVRSRMRTPVSGPSRSGEPEATRAVAGGSGPWAPSAGGWPARQGCRESRNGAPGTFSVRRPSGNSRQKARAHKLWVIEQFEERRYGRHGDARFLADRDDLGAGPFEEPITDQGVEGVGVLGAGGAVVEARVGVEFAEPGDGHEALGLVFGRSADGDVPILAGVDRDRVEGVVAVADATLDLAAVGPAQGGPLVEAGHRLHVGDLDLLAAAGGFAGTEGSHDPDEGVEAGGIFGLAPRALYRFAVAFAGEVEVAPGGEVGDRG